MLARLEPRLPTSMPWRYEPKLDGFRGLLWHRANGSVVLVSRNGRDLAAWFPELVLAGQNLPLSAVVDGEILIANADGCVDFGALQDRLTVARRAVFSTAWERPAVLLAFDLLELSGANLIDEPLHARRRRLEQLVAAVNPCLQLIEQTADVDLARDWLALVPNIEGVVAKRADRPYSPGRSRDWIKVKRYRTVECAVIGIADDSASPKLMLGLCHQGGALHHIGVSRPLQAMQIGPLLPLLQSAGPVEPAIRSRWQHDAVPPWRRVPRQLVCEVRYTTVDNSRWFRLPATFVRWRPDRSPDDCGLDQLSLNHS